MLCAPPVADLAAIFAVPCCLAEITAAGYALYPPREAGCTDGIRAVLTPFRGHFSTPLRCPAVSMPCVRTSLCYHTAIRHMKFQRIAFWHINMVHLFQKDGFIKFIKPQNFRTDFNHVFVVDGAAHRTAGSFLLFLLAATVPELLIATVCPLVVHIALTAVWAFDFSCKAGCVQTLICQCAKFPAPCHLLLHKVKSGLVDYGRMGVLHIVLRKFPSVLFPLLGDWVGDKLLLQEQVPRVGHIGQYHLDVGIYPTAAVPGCDALGSKLPLGFQPGFPVQEVPEDSLYNLRFLWHDDQFIALPSITVDAEVAVWDAVLHPFSDAPFHIVGNAAALLLGKGRQDGQHQFAVPIHRAYAFFLELHLNA